VVGWALALLMPVGESQLFTFQEFLKLVFEQPLQLSKLD
jgi:hypothetical protein